MTAPHLYVHIPFCARRCTYCDFSIAVRRRVPVGEYLEALAREISGHGTDAQTHGRTDALETVYLGGGTPSLLGGEGIAALVKLLALPLDLAEFTLEANPDDVTLAAVSSWAHAGVDRLSIGAQSFDPRVLAWMHRTHDAPAIAQAVRTARRGGIGNLSLDLIFALPDALGRDWQRDLDAAMALGPDHISLYGLTVETGTVLSRQIARGEVAAAPDARWEDQYLLAHSRLTARGFFFYEVSNAARPGREARHNRAYWRLAPYLGVGPSAHSFDGVARWWNEPAYSKWRDLLTAGRSPVAGCEILRDPERRLEELYLGLRTSDGAALPDPCPERLAETVERWVRVGWAEFKSPEAQGPSVAGGRGPSRPTEGSAPGTPRAAPAPARLRLTSQGWLRLDEFVSSI